MPIHQKTTASIVQLQVLTLPLLCCLLHEHAPSFMLIYLSVVLEKSLLSSITADANHILLLQNTSSLASMEKILGLMFTLKEKSRLPY